jgi:23S rRNA (adenine2503-C2)-methyltransferase
MKSQILTDFAGSPPTDLHPLKAVLPSLSLPSIQALAQQLQAWGAAPSHAGPLLRAYYSSEPTRAIARLRLPKGLLERLFVRWPAHIASTAFTQSSADGTCKILLRFGDQRTAEAVLMPDYRPDRGAGCISSQVGCAMGCDFCATAQSGFDRNLTTAEIIEQFLALRRHAATLGRRLHTLVFMGMGEPMLNLPNVLEAVSRIGCNQVGALGWRQITISTVGIVPGIHTLAQSGFRVNLALSLHAPNDSLRGEILPLGKRYGVHEVLAAGDAFHAATGRPVTIQYCLLNGVNDHDSHAYQLARLLQARRFHVNLLNYNPTGKSLKGILYSASPPEAVARFSQILASAGVNAHSRRARGPDIDAACGQLRRRPLPDSEPSTISKP